MESAKAKQLLNRQIEATSSLAGSESHQPHFKKWKRDTEVAIEKIFGKPSRHLKDFLEIRYSSGIWFSGMAADSDLRACKSGLADACAILQSMIDEIDEFGFADSGVESSLSKSGKDSRSSKQLFISHSSLDKDLAEALVDLISDALLLPRGEILCTSVEGTKLKGGDDTDIVLRQVISQVPAFISILTRKSVSSTYVLFELGARWGCNKHHIPLLAKSAGTEVLKEPLKKNALKLGVTSDVLQLLGDLASVLNRQVQPPNGYVKKVEAVVETASKGDDGFNDPLLHIEISKSLVRKGNLYYRLEGDKKTGPYCMACWDGDGKLVNVMLLPRGLMKCGRCAKPRTD